ncbi:MAG TPA: hypothetical protein G4O12_03045 [Dehalococcoidia bacterium]|nr:hypothetical protein [Dehalococcoidia bacterium]
MQILVMLLFLAVWLSILWLGSIALEATGMERTKARFQALSALTGTGFTTREAESIVNHPKRRQIATYLIFIGNAGIIAFIILLVLYVRAGLVLPSISLIVIIIAILLAIGLTFWLGLIDKLTNAILNLVGKGHTVSNFTVEEILHQGGDYAVVRFTLSEQATIANLKLKDAGFQERAITILAIERGESILSYPQPEEKLLIGDNLLCYGKLAEISDIARGVTT